MKKQKRNDQFGLSVLLSLFIFCVIMGAAGFFSALVVYLQIRFGPFPIGERAFVPVYLLLLIGFLSVIVGFLLSGKILLRPVRRLTRQMNRLASGDFSARISFDEQFAQNPILKEITKSFNTMAQELENTELLRSDFINNFSHEFKTPIVSIAGFAKLLKRGNLTPAQTAEYLDIIEKESLRLSAMATNVLNMTKVENQTILTDVTRYNLSEQLRHCILLLEEKWSKKNIEFQLEFDEHHLHANKELLQHVWINLLDNAIKFSPEGNTVTVTVSDIGDQLTVTVENNGDPIPQAQQARIFNKFYQADESHSTEGNGIGLALVRRTVELHRGTVSVSSDSVTVFTVTLPKEQ